MKMKKVLALLLALVMVLALAACNNSSEKESSSGNEGDQGDLSGKRIYVLVKNSDSDFWVSMGDYAKAQGEKYGWTVEVHAPIVAESNEEQIELLEQSLLDPPDAYCIAPADSSGITPAIEEINEAGIPIINLNTKFFDENLEYLTYVAAENSTMGYDSAKLACEQILNGKGKVLVLDGTTGSSTSIERQEGSQKAFDEFPDIEVLDRQAADFARATALTVTQNLLQKYDDVDMIWASAGEMALGAAVAVEQTGRDIPIATINAFGEMIVAWCDGRIALTVDDASWLQGQTAIECLYKYWSGEELEPVTYIQHRQVTKDLLPEYIEMFHLDIDPDNIDRD